VLDKEVLDKLKDITIKPFAPTPPGFKNFVFHNKTFITSSSSSTANAWSVRVRQLQRGTCGAMRYRKLVLKTLWTT
jgi:hypothetical protein